jgi:Gluconate 2-dehydrogenase subunit 3
MTFEPGNEFDRRKFLRSGLQSAGAAWVILVWPEAMKAAQHAAQARQSPAPSKLEVLTAGQGIELDAVAGRIIPSDDSPGAREAGVIYFIDRALATFASGALGEFQEGLSACEAKTRELFPKVDKFSAATPEQQDAVLRELEQQPFFQTMRTLTVMGFLADPMRGGNRDGVGWNLIGFDASLAFVPPFGYYDRDYPGWKPPTKQEETR